MESHPITSHIPLSNAVPAGFPRRYRPSLKGLALIIGGLLLAGGMASSQQGRLPWVTTDYKVIQGNYLGKYHIGEKKYVSVCSANRVYTIQIADQVHPKFPNVGGLVEIKYTGGFKQIVNEKDVTTVLYPDTDPEREELPTNYGLVE